MFTRSAHEKSHSNAEKRQTPRYPWLHGSFDETQDSEDKKSAEKR